MIGSGGANLGNGLPSRNGTKKIAKNPVSKSCISHP